jgi:2-hydroxychromene-2-carboxylate isomerase
MTEIVFNPSFSSSYSYFAAHLIDDVAARHASTVVWRPIRLARIHAHHHPEGRPPRLAVRNRYLRRDAERIAALRGLPLVFPTAFPPDSDLTAEICYALADRPGGVRRAVLALMTAVYGQGRPMRTPEEIAEGLAAAGYAAAEIRQAAADPAGKAGHDAAIAAALESGMFGAPWFTVEGEAFWGHDRLPYIEDWLRRRGA